MAVRRRPCYCWLALAALFLCYQDCVLSFTPNVLAASTTATAVAPTEAAPAAPVLETKDVVTKVAVTGATGRTGRLVVEELLARNVNSVVAFVRSKEKAAEVFPNPPGNLEIVQCNLADEKEIEKALVDQGVDAAIWCATGFSSDPNVGMLEKIKRLLKIAVADAKRSIDAVGLPVVAKTLIQLEQKTESDNNVELPKVVMCSSAGVTRPSWDDEMKERFPGAADIPIVRLNPFGILDIKRDSEELLRQSGINYCIVRPCGLNDDWPANSRPVFSQGDVAVGRMNREDVAAILVDVLSTPEATDKTFEVVGLAGYPKAASIGSALEPLVSDRNGGPSMDSIAATYVAMQQLLPGEKQDSAALAMGQTYEQLDKGQVGRLGKRGEEDAEEAAPKPSN